MVRTDATFSDACGEYLRWIEFDRQRKASTLLDYRSAIDTHLRPAFGTWALEDNATRDVEQWRDGMRATGVLSREGAARDARHSCIRRRPTIRPVVESAPSPGVC